MEDTGKTYVNVSFENYNEESRKKNDRDAGGIALHFDKKVTTDKHQLSRPVCNSGLSCSKDG